MKINTTPIILLFIITVCSCNIYGQNVEINISGIKNNKGVIKLAVFTNQQEFDKESPVTGRAFPKRNVRNGKLKINMKLKPGNYAIALLDDENEDGQMNYNFLGLPLEGFGFSNYYTSGMRKPKYSDFNFDVKKGNNKVEIKIRYVL